MSADAATMRELSVVQLFCWSGWWLLPAGQISGDLVTVHHFLPVTLLPRTLTVRVGKCRPCLSESADLHFSIYLQFGVIFVSHHSWVV